MSDHTSHAEFGAAFNEHYPLPFRILTLISLGIVAFASNLQILANLGIDPAVVLDVRSDAMLSDLSFVSPSKLYKPIYLLAVFYITWTALGWALYSVYLSSFEHLSVYFSAAIALLGVLAVFLPTERMQKRERFMFLRSMKRIFFDGLWSPVPFCDVILADILTSFAKVLGDVWICVGLLVGQDTRSAWGGYWGVPLLTSLPYILRFRQCISEYLTTPSVQYASIDPQQNTLLAALTPSNPRTRSLCNALKYASAFPVILFSAMQTRSDFFDSSPEELAEAGIWLGPTSLFNLWILAVFFNSFYSFWWDVTNDWGLGLLIPRSWKATPAFVASHIRRMSMMPSSTNSSSQAKYSQIHSRRSVSVSSADVDSKSNPTASTSRSTSQHLYTSPTHAVMHSCSNPLLRSSTLLPDTIIYYSAIAIDLLLRFTWSLKLSSHLHAIHEIEQGVFLLEASEVLRRWMWVFLRIEWEAVKKSTTNHDKASVEISLVLAEDELNKS